MPRNPIYSTGRDAQNMGVNTPAKGAEPHKSYIQLHNDFNVGYKQGSTMRYGDVHPFFVMDGLPADRIPFENQHSLRSYTLQAPLESELYLHKSMTMVPMKAILPNTWDRFIVNPTKGDDVPDDVYCSIQLHAILSSLRSAFYRLRVDPHAFVKMAFILENVFSRGCLLANLKSDFSSAWKAFSGYKRTFDDWFDLSFYPWLKNSTIVVRRELGDGEFENIAFAVVPEYTLKATSPHTVFESLRDGCGFSFGTVPDFTSYESSYAELYNSLTNVLNSVSLGNLDISRAVAYQLSCVTCLSDDSIDNIYTDALFRNMMYEFYDPEFFFYNGEPIQYDAFSANRIHSIFLNASTSDETLIDKYYGIFTLLFSFRRSLKFSDYFIDARPEPYSVGEMSAEVRDGRVSAIDQTVSILKQRFLNWSNRVGNKLYDYILSLTGVSPSASNDETKYIVHETYSVRGFEVENTGSEQRNDLTVTTLLKTQQSKYLYNIELTEYCILLGLAHFDMERMYVGIVDKLTRKSNRFDFFNKFFQYSGDQAIDRSELCSGHLASSEPLAYTTRHMQYKTAINHCTGGFASGALPGWLNTSDYDDSSQSAISSLRSIGINSEFIRNHSEDFDKFYSALSAVSLGNYFHFSINWKNISSASRQMAVAPDIL